MEKRCDYYENNSSLIIRKVVKLMEDSTNLKMVDEHIVMLLNDFLNACPYAFWVRDLPFIIRVIELLSERVDTSSEHAHYLVQMLNACRVPPMLIKVSEVLVYQRDLVEFFSMFGYMLVKFSNDEMQDLVCEVFNSLIKRNVHIKSSCVSWDICTQAISKSELPEIVTRLAEIAEEDFYIKLLNLTELMLDSEAICYSLSKCGILNPILLRIDPEWNVRKVTDDDTPNYSLPSYLDSSLTILWRLLSVMKNNPMAQNEIPVADKKVWRSVHRIFRLLVLAKTMKKKRNTLVSIIVTFGYIYKSLYPLYHPFAKDIVLICSAPELGSGGTWASEVRFISDEYDYALKETLLLFICRIKTTPVIQESVIRSILRIITPQVDLIWHKKHRRRLMLLSLRTLGKIIHKTLDYFLENNGPLRLLHLTRMYVMEDLRGNILLASLRAMYSSVRSRHPAVLEGYRNNNAMDLLVSLIENFLTKDLLTNEIQTCLLDSFFILQILNECFEYSDERAMKICMFYLKLHVEPSVNNMPVDSRVIICLLDFLWENITWSSMNLKYFVSKGGVYTLLDVIQKCCLPIQLISLSILVDLCEEGSCIPHLLTWRGLNKTIIPMLLDIFRKENVKLGVKSTARGVIADVELPLMGRRQWKNTFTVNKNHNSSPALIDLLSTCRPKIYAIFHLFSCRFEEKVSIINKHYKIYSNLSTDDQITKLLAEYYLPLKLGEAWVELNRDLQIAGIRPLSFDQQVISKLVRRFYKWSLHIKTAQEEVLRREKYQDGVEERLLYNILREARLLDSLEALNDLRFIARCTENIFRLMTKMQQNDSMKISLLYDHAFFGKFHQTFSRDSKCALLYNQKLNIHSNVISDPNASYDLELVPPTSEASESPK